MSICVLEKAICQQTKMNLTYQLLESAVPTSRDKQEWNVDQMADLHSLEFFPLTYKKTDVTFNIFPTVFKTECEEG